jgi:segregation and condensation protein A
VSDNGLPAEAEQAGGLRIHAGTFEGPLDLLLHLVRINEVDITDIPIVAITEQYNAYLELMRELNLEIAGEYLVMAATLMHIKSRMLLPPDPVAQGEEEPEDPRAELARQLADYQRFKQAAENLQAMESRRGLVWTREAVPVEFAGEELLEVDLFDLLRAFRELLGRLDEQSRIELRRDTVSVAEKMEWLAELLERRSSVSLAELFEHLPTRLDRIATFLAMLEMMRLGLLVAFQRRSRGEISLAAAPPRPVDPAAEPIEATDDGPTGDRSGRAQAVEDAS